MKQYRVLIAPVVKQQIREQMMYIAQHSVDHALAWEDRLQSAIKELAFFSGYSVGRRRNFPFGLHVAQVRI
jgi:hypothetical protein